MVALPAAPRTGKARPVACPMLACMMQAASLQFGELWGTGSPPKRLGSRHPRNPPYRAFEASDKSFVIAPRTHAPWHKGCDVVGPPPPKDDATFATGTPRADHEPAPTRRLHTTL